MASTMLGDNISNGIDIGNDIQMGDIDMNAAGAQSQAPQGAAPAISATALHTYMVDDIINNIQFGVKRMSIMLDLSSADIAHDSFGNTLSASAAPGDKLHMTLYDVNKTHGSGFTAFTDDDLKKARGLACLYFGFLNKTEPGKRYSGPTSLDFHLLPPEAEFPGADVVGGDLELFYWFMQGELGNSYENDPDLAERYSLESRLLKQLQEHFASRLNTRKDGSSIRTPHIKVRNVPNVPKNSNSEGVKKGNNENPGGQMWKKGGKYGAKGKGKSGNGAKGKGKHCDGKGKDEQGKGSGKDGGNGKGKYGKGSQFYGKGAQSWIGAAPYHLD